jgi:hypothetical protein
MDLIFLTITPRALEQFREVYRIMNPSADGLKHAERTCRRILRHAQPPTLDFSDVFHEEEGVTILNVDRYLFAISESGVLVAVADSGKYLGAIASRRISQLKRERAALGLRSDTLISAAPLLDLAKLRFSARALEQFGQRFPGHANPNPESGARELFAHSSQEHGIDGSDFTNPPIGFAAGPDLSFRLGKCRFKVREYLDGSFEVFAIEWARPE